MVEWIWAAENDNNPPQSQSFRSLTDPPKSGQPHKPGAPRRQRPRKFFRPRILDGVPPSDHMRAAGTPMGGVPRHHQRILQEEVIIMAFRPLHDRVVVRRIEAEEKTAGGIIIPDSA